MKREIKFRAWDNVHQCFDENVAANLLMQLHDPYEEVDEKYGERFFLSQYTGLKDKNGKEIYEGDIYNMGDRNILYVVLCRDSGLIGKQISSSSYAGLEHWQDKIEIIGNIFENPELLK